MRIHTLTILFLLSTFLSAQAQKEQKIKLGKISMHDFKNDERDHYDDPDAIILAKKAELQLQYNRGKETVEYRYDEIKRIKVLSEEGKRYADQSITVYEPIGQRFKEELRSLKGYTYNIDGSRQLIKTKLNGSQKIETRINDYYVKYTVTFPEVNVGSVIELEYSMESVFLSNLREFHIQEDLPINYLEYKYTIPNYYDYQVLQLGNTIPLKLDKRSYNAQFQYGPGVQASIESTEFHILGEHIEPYKVEPYMANEVDIPARLKFQLVGINHVTKPYEPLNNTYDDLARSWMEHESFGEIILNPKKYDSILPEDGSEGVTLANAIYANFLSEFEWDGNKTHHTSSSFKELTKDQTGTSGTLNLHMIAAMRQAGLEVYPVILSTRGNGIPHPVYPNAEFFNYVIAGVVMADEIVYYDATAPLFPGFLPTRALNGNGLLIQDETSTWVDLKEKQIRRETYKFDYTIDNEYLLCDITFKINEHACPIYLLDALENPSALESALQDGMKEWEIISFNLDSTQAYTEEIKFNMSLRKELDDPDVIYLEPFITGPLLENPFTADKRFSNINFPVGMKCKAFSTITIPPDYTVEVPESAVVKLDEKRNRFVYTVTQKENKVSILSNCSFNITSIPPDAYVPLKEFYDFMSDKNNSIVILSKM